MKCWIVGKSGMLSRAFQRVLKKEEIAFFATSKEEIDITQLPQVQDFFNRYSFTHVINCSGFTDVDLAETCYDTAYALNVQGVVNLAKFAYQYQKKLIHFSTDYVFDGTKNAPYLEDDPCNPLSVYGKTKSMGEKELFALHPNACLIRSSWLFGKEGKNFVKKMVALMKECERIEVVEDQVGCPTFCDDLAKAALVLEKQEGIFHFVNRGKTSWYLFALEIFNQLKRKGGLLKCKEVRPISSQEYGSIAPRPAYSVLSTKKYEGVQGFMPRLWESCLHEVIGERNAT